MKRAANKPEALRAPERQLPAKQASAKRKTAKRAPAKRTARKQAASAVAVEVAEVPAVAGMTVKTLKPSGCRSYLRREAAKAFPSVVDGFLEQARGGSCQHLRFLTEMFEQTRPNRKARAEKGVAQALVDEWLGG